METQTELLLIGILAATPLYLLLRMPWRKKDAREVPLGIFWVFMMTLGLLTLAGNIPHGNFKEIIDAAAERIRTGKGINLVPLKTIRGFFTIRGADAYYVNIVGNIIMFMPLGFFLPMLWRRMNNFFRLNFTLVLVPLFIETLQLFVNRHVDVDDIILNFVGGAAGALLYMMVKLIVPKIKKFAR